MTDIQLAEVLGQGSLAQLTDGQEEQVNLEFMLTSPNSETVLQGKSL